MSRPLALQWGKTANTWHLDIDGVGRYSVQRTDKGGPWGAYLNNQRLSTVTASRLQELVKTQVEDRVTEARRINALPAEVPGATLHKEVITAAIQGVREYTRSTRGAHALGALSRIIETNKGFCLVYGDDNRIYFDVTEM